VLTFLLVAGPWYTWVALETKGEWTHGFFGKHNFERFQHPLENHGGPVFYYLLVLLVGFAPWSVFLGPALRDAWTQLRPKPRSALRFLACWAFVYLGVFTVAGTKLPNYVLPIYPALALLTARFLDRWRRGEAHPAAWELPTSLGFLALVGVAAAVGLLTVGGVFGADVLRGRILPGVERLAWLGLLPVAGAVLGWGSLRQDRRTGLIAAAVLTGVLFTAGLAAFGESAVDRYKAAKPLAEALPTDQTRRDVRIGTFDYFQPSLVFYCRRKVQTFSQEQDALDLLRGPMPSFLFVPSARWDAMKDRLDVPYRLLARHYDLYAGKDVVVVTNR
jgi:4-amino-4-deoxy-L-arabinose transferase-like glycosyltransferase